VLIADTITLEATAEAIGVDVVETAGEEASEVIELIAMTVAFGEEGDVITPSAVSVDFVASGADTEELVLSVDVREFPRNEVVMLGVLFVVTKLGADISGTNMELEELRVDRDVLVMDAGVVVLQGVIDDEIKTLPWLGGPT
jgi:hypothetical protein